MKVSNLRKLLAGLGKKQKKFYLFLGLLFSCSILTGCSFSAYNIHSGPEPKNFFNEKYYVNSIKGGFVTPQQEQDIKEKLPIQHPDFFVKDPSKGRPVDFYWSLEYNTPGYPFTGFCGLTFGLIPCVGWSSHVGSLTAKLQSEKIGFFDHSSFKGRTYPYLVKEVTFLHVFPVISHIVHGFWGFLAASGKDTVSSFNAETRESLSAPHNCCEANLRLFPKACNLMMGQVRARETKEKVQAMKSAQKKAAADSLKKIKPNTKNTFTLPVPPKMQEVGPKPRSVLLGKWNCQLLSKIKVVIKSHEEITSMLQDITYSFMNDGKVIIETVSKGRRPSKSKNLADFHYNGQTLTIKSKDTQGRMVVMQYKVIWYSDTKMELQILDTKEYEKRFLGGTGIKKASYTVADNGISTTILYFETIQNGKKNTFHTEFLTSPSIYNKTVK